MNEHEIFFYIFLWETGLNLKLYSLNLILVDIQGGS